MCLHYSLQKYVKFPIFKTWAASKLFLAGNNMIRAIWGGINIFTWGIVDRDEKTKGR